ncbi:MAG TPA: regulatory protein RecX [Gemmatimonadaceae bacterium]|nr:regulatory protein RecX [Gemmatimonadaceae bacterium]
MPNEIVATVASIDEHPKRRGRFVVFVGAEPIATVTADAISELRIHVGDALTEKTLDALRVHDRRTTVLDRALRLLAVRARSAAELTRTLMRGKDRPLAEDVKWVQQVLAKQGYIDDARFADQFVRDRATIRGWGKQRLTSELRRRGVAQAHIGSAMSQASEDAALDDARSASAVALKWRRTHSGRDPDRDKQRLYGFLARRGFSPDVIRVAMREALADAEGESS